MMLFRRFEEDDGPLPRHTFYSQASDKSLYDKTANLIGIAHYKGYSPEIRKERAGLHAQPVSSENLIR